MLELDSAAANNVVIRLAYVEVLQRSNWPTWAMMRDEPARLMHGQSFGHGRKPANQEQNATGRPRRPTMTAKLEYLPLDLGSVTTVPATAPNATVAAAFNSRVADNLVRLSVNYRFDPNAIWSYD
jgi:hypothetical protein